TPHCRALFYLSPTFDASVSDIGTALLSGAALCVEPGVRRTPASMMALIRERGVTHLDLPPSVLATLDPGELPASVQTIVIGGEVCPADVVRRWASRVRLVNVYGPTEATICTSLGACDPETWDRPLIGRPLPGIGYEVVDEALDPVPQGTPGELLIDGVGLARGYLNDPELTRKRFPTLRGRRVYRTGDRVVLHHDGEFEFLGRIDRQIKLHGLRIEPE